MRILQINDCPTAVPVNGGQRRADQTAKVLSSAGHDVARLAVFRVADEVRSAAEDWFDVSSLPSPRHWLTRSLDLAIELARDEAALERFSAQCDAARPDVVLLGMPWLWPAVRRLPAIAAGRMPLVYNCCRIESSLDCALIHQAGVPDAGAMAVEVEALERELAVHATLCAAVSSSDADQLRAWGARAVVIAPNGFERRDRGALIRVLPELLPPWSRFLIYIASEHPTNVPGLKRILPAVLESLHPGERIVVAGGVAGQLACWIATAGLAPLARDRVLMFGDIDDFALDAVIHNASGFLLPIDEGGASRSKTAEAIGSGLPLVATPFAMRGFEEFIAADGVLLAETEIEFSRAVRRVFDDPPPRRASSAAIENLRWDRTLRPLVDAVGNLGHAIRPVEPSSRP